MSIRRVVSAVLIPATLLLFTGCTKTVWIGPEEFRPEHKLRGVVTADGQEVKLDRVTVRGDTIYAYAGADAFRFTLNEVERVGVQRPNPAATVAVFLGTVLVVALAASAIAVVASMDEWSLSDSPFEY